MSDPKEESKTAVTSLSSTLVSSTATGFAKAAGKDGMGQTMIAVQAVQQARPNMTAADALAAVNLVQQK